MTYRLTRRARQDIQAAADRFVDLLVRHFQLIGDNPYIGRRRDQLRSGYRSFPVSEYLIFYRVSKPGVQIMHVVHGRRDLQAYFRR